MTVVPEAVASMPPPGRRSKSSTGATWRSVIMQRGARTSHSRTVWSYEPVAKVCGEAGLSMPERTKSVWPVSAQTSASAVTSQTRALASSDAVKTREPSAPKRATCTAFSCPPKVRITVREPTSKSCVTPRSSLATSMRPSWR